MASSRCALHNLTGGADLTMSCGQLAFCYTANAPPQPPSSSSSSSTSSSSALPVPVCTCWSGGCTVTPNPADTTFDMCLSAGGLDGSLALASGGSDLVVHFTAAAAVP
ncbi:MAG: hypothetical protein ABSF69_27665 [Polyangiaceae bacterium]|jgi:hypothetical protein